jgi:hypothetical protein
MALNTVLRPGTYTTASSSAVDDRAAYCIHLLLNTPRENTEARSDLFV